MRTFGQMQIERLDALRELIAERPEALFSRDEEEKQGAVLDATNVVLGGLTAARTALLDVMVTTDGGMAKRAVWKAAELAIITAERAVMAARDANGRRELQLRRWDAERRRFGRAA